jgi:hypothetical protein
LSVRAQRCQSHYLSTTPRKNSEMCSVKNIRLTEMFGSSVFLGKRDFFNEIIMNKNWESSLL